MSRTTKLIFALVVGLLVIAYLRMDTADISARWGRFTPESKLPSEQQQRLQPGHEAAEKERQKAKAKEKVEQALQELVMPPKDAPGGPWGFLRKPKFLFIFGDSLISEAWDWQKAPNPINPHQIFSNADGPVWTRNLTRKWDSQPDSKYKTSVANMAVDFAPIDTTITPVDSGTKTMDLQHQLNVFEKYFTTKKAKPSNEKDSHIRILGGLGSENTAKPKVVKWNPYEAVFVVAFGTNDAALSLSTRIKTSAKSTFLRLAASHTAALQRLYKDGARAFVLPNVMPLERSPWALQAVALSKNVQAVDSIAKAVKYWNSGVLQNASKWCKEHADVRCLFLDVHGLGERVLDAPDQFGFLYSDEYCESYANRRNSDPDTDHDPWCKGPLREYIWRDSIHPSYAFHELWADLYEKEVDALFKEEQA